MYQDFRDIDFTYKGKKVISGIKLEHHIIYSVYDKNSYSSYSNTKVYKEYAYVPLNKFNPDLVFINEEGKSSRRNQTIFNDYDTNLFWVIKSKGTSTSKEIKKELKYLKKDLEIKLKDFQAVVPMKLESYSKSSYTSGIPAYLANLNSWYTKEFRLYYNSKTKTLFKDKEQTNPLDLNSYCFVGVSRANARPNYNQTRYKMNFVHENSNKEIIMVGRTNYEKILKIKGIHTVEKLYDTLFNKYRKEYLIKGRINLIATAINNSHIIDFRYLDMIPKGILPECARGFSIKTLSEAYNNWDKYLDKVKGDIKFDYEGFIKKIKNNLEKYPLLKDIMAYSNVSNPETKNKIELYIKQVDYYETKA